MCGIFGMVKHSGHQQYSDQVVSEKIDSALDVLEHRGPDGAGKWMSGSKNAALGHVRLSIIDLGSGQQPLLNKRDGLAAVVNGEFYDYERIRESFLQSGYPFQTHSDSEIVLALYRKYGTKAMSHLRGEFAFALWDEKENRLFAARDRFGIKPLYYAVHDGYVYFASEIKSLFSAGVPAKWSKDAYVSRSFYFGDETLYEGIYQVPPGHFMIVKKGYVRTYQYWDVEYPDREENKTVSMSEKECVDTLREKFEEAIKLRLRSDVEVGVYLSGGIDSSSVLAVADKFSDKPLNTFTLCFDEKDEYNERSYAKIMANHVSANFNPIRVTQKSIADHFEKSVWHNELPFFNGHGIAKYLLSQEVNKAGIKVVLTGEGADEIFSGYPHYQRDMVLYNSDGQNPDSVAALRKKILSHEGSVNQPNDQYYPLLKAELGFNPSWMQYQSQWMGTLEKLLVDDCQQSFVGNHPYQELMKRVDVKEKLASYDPVHASMYLWAKTFLPNFLLKTLGDRMEMANSLEGRLAFLDHHLAEFAAKIPVSMKLDSSSTKQILRKAMAPYLPKEIAQRKKHYFRAPQALLSPDSKLYQFIADKLHSRSAINLPFFDQDKVIQLFNQHDQFSHFEQFNLDGVFTEIASLVVLQDKFSIAS